MLPPLFPPTFLKNTRKMNNNYPLVGLSSDPSKNELKTSTRKATECPQTDENRDYCDNATSSDNSVHNSSFEKQNSSFSEEQGDSETDEQSGHIPASNQFTKPNNQLPKKRKSSPEFGSYDVRPNYTEIIQEQYKHTLPWLVSQWSAAGHNLNDFWQRFKETSQKEKVEEISDKQRSRSENINSQNLSEESEKNKNKYETNQHQKSSKFAPIEATQTFKTKRSHSLPNDSSCRDDVISESFSDPGKQSPTHSSDDDIFPPLMYAENSDKQAADDEKNSSETSQFNKVTRLVQFDSQDSSKLINSMDGLQKNLTPANMLFPPSSLSQNENEFSSNKDKSAVPGGEIHGGVWIPTRSRNCHLCGKEFKNVYR